jgi:hypothetical protein
LLEQTEPCFVFLIFEAGFLLRRRLRLDGISSLIRIYLEVEVVESQAQGLDVTRELPNLVDK